MNEKSLFDSFPTLQDASELTSILESNNIEFSIVENSFDVDITFTGNKISGIQVFIDSDNFDLVNKLLEEQAENQIDLTDKTHYLFKFSNEELYDILAKRDEWSTYDYAFAKKLLQERGEDISQERLNSIKTERNKELDHPEKSSSIQIAIGYGCAILGGALAILIKGVLFLLFITVMGLLIGWYLWKSKKTTSKGDKIFAYSENDRKHGKNISIIGIVILVGYLTYRISIFLSQVS